MDRLRGTSGVLVLMAGSTWACWAVGTGALGGTLAWEPFVLGLAAALSAAEVARGHVLGLLAAVLLAALAAGSFTPPAPEVLRIASAVVALLSVVASVAGRQHAVTPAPRPTATRVTRRVL